MEIPVTTSGVTFILGVLGVIFATYKYFKDPQNEEEKKAALLAQQVNASMESVDRRFKEMQDNFKDLLLQSNNHIHTVDTKVEALSLAMSSMSNSITKLSTIIEERIPKK